MLHSSLLHETAKLAIDDRVLILNSAADPFVLEAAHSLSAGELILAEDNLASLQQFNKLIGTDVSPMNKPIGNNASRPSPMNKPVGVDIPNSSPMTPLVGAGLSRPAPIYRPPVPIRKPATTQLHVRHVPFHEYTLREAPATIDIAIMNILYQPSNAWMVYALQVAAYALKPGGRLYVVGAKDRGVLSIAKRMQALFGNLETLAISKGQRVVYSHMQNNSPDIHSQQGPLQASTISDTQNVVDMPSPPETVPLAGAISDAILANPIPSLLPTTFAEGKLDEGTRLLVESLDVHTTDVALDIGCGAGYLGMHIAYIARKGHVTMVDASLVVVAAARNMVEKNGMTNVQVLASDGTQAVKAQRFDLVVTNPPFHLGGIQTTEIGDRFIRETAHVLRPRGRFYLVANRFLKYEPTMQSCFHSVEEVGGNTRYKVLLATNPIMSRK
jgi:16S rRNA (guanine1207-N2)-methyltransferase